MPQPIDFHSPFKIHSPLPFPKRIDVYAYSALYNQIVQLSEPKSGQGWGGTCNDSIIHIERRFALRAGMQNLKEGEMEYLGACVSCAACWAVQGWQADARGSQLEPLAQLAR